VAGICQSHPFSCGLIRNLHIHLKPRQPIAVDNLDTTEAKNLSRIEANLKRNEYSE